jgi:ectoine hydroxylase-related dioxygenase (phytanoyl-CoA dioxygenase family)
MLTEQQVTFFNTFGFIILRKVFSENELAIINDEFNRGALGKRQIHPTLTNWSNLSPETSFLSVLPEDPRICETAEQLFGEDAVAMSSNSSRRVGDTHWHTDRPDPHSYGMKFSVYLQPIDTGNGALRVIPGSHKKPYIDKLKEIDLNTPDISVPSYTCVSYPGDIVLFNLALWHSSWGGSSDRRVCTMDFYKNPKTPEEEETIYEQVKIDKEAYAKFRTSGTNFHPHWLANSQNSPRRQRWIDWLRKYGYVEFNAT